MPQLVPLNLLNEIIEETIFKSRYGETLKKLQPETNFNEREVEALALVHHAIEKTRGPVTRGVFRDIAHSGFDFTENIRHLLVDRIFSTIDKKNTQKLSNDAFVAGLSPILRGNLKQKTSFAYKVYDLMKTNKLTKDQIFPMLRGCFIKMQPEESPDENVRELVELLIKSIDIDRDGDVSPDEFLEAVTQKNSLFLECMGPVLPSREAAYAFLSTITNEIPKF